MSRVLITGMSGAGKSTLLSELARRGHLTVDTDYGGWVLPDGLWDVARMTALLCTSPNLVVSGTVSNQGAFYDRFDEVVLLSAPVEVLLERLSTRVDNPYGGTAEQRTEVIGYVGSVEPLLRASATLELDGRRPVSELADQLEAPIGPDQQGSQ